MGRARFHRASLRRWRRGRGAHPRPPWQQQGPRPGPLEALRRHPRQSLLICGITAGGTIAYCTWTSYLPTYAELNAGVEKSDALLAGTISLAFFGLLQPLGGLLSDRFGRRPLLLTFGLGFALLTVPLLHALRDSFAELLLVQCAGMVLLTGITTISAAVNARCSRRGCGRRGSGSRTR
ncbi:alpha-ketoglutarate permease [Streptomyces jeddahensis]|uniref:Alpha-ketoglutarate permease n=1 Tax=Streptomyces jeddahensis TaxID=1716141 RepID=A0A177HHJ9_9ACTN|nr:alpha-ketoglutarate permease [Streptomyces jeddahensis]